MFCIHIFLPRNSLTTILDDIKNNKHDRGACESNCKSNGKAFNQNPHQCRYYNGYSKYQNLLEYQELQRDETDGVTTYPTQKPIFKDFGFKLIVLEDEKEEVLLGIRKGEDIIAVEESVGKL